MNVARAAKPWATGMRGTRRSLGRRRPGNGLASRRAIISSVTSKAPRSSPGPCSPGLCSPGPCSPGLCSPALCSPATGARRAPGLGDNLGHRFRDGDRVRSPHGDRANAQHDRGGDETDPEPGQRRPARPQVAQPDREPGEGDAGVTEDHGGRHAHAGGPLGAQAATRHPGTQHVGTDAGSEQPCDQRRDGERATRKPRWAAGLARATASAPVLMLTFATSLRSVPRFRCGYWERTCRVRAAEAGLARGFRAAGERFGMQPVVVLGQHRAGLAGSVGEGAAAYLAARDRKMRHRHRESRRI